MERYKCITGDDSLEEDDDGPYALYADAQATVEALQKKYDDLLGKYHQLMDFYDKHNGTPCEQIRHEQQVEALQRERDELQVQLRLSRFNQANAEAEYNGLQAQIRTLTQQRDAERDRLRDELDVYRQAVQYVFEAINKFEDIQRHKAALTPAGGGG